MERNRTLGWVTWLTLAAACSSCGKDERRRAPEAHTDGAGDAEAAETSRSEPPRPLGPDELLQAALQRAAHAPRPQSNAVAVAPRAAPSTGNTDPLAEGDARSRALRDAQEFGMLGLLDSDGGRGEGIGLGSVGTIGHGAGTGTGQGFGSSHGRLGGSHRAKPPQVRMGATNVSGRLPPEVIQRIVRQNFGRFRMCYEQALRNDPNLAGRVTVNFVIGTDGGVSNVTAGGDFPDATVPSCVSRQFYALKFPQPEGGIVTVAYPIVFSPGDGEAAPAKTGARYGVTSSAPPETSDSAPPAATGAERAGAPSASADAQPSAAPPAVASSAGPEHSPPPATSSGAQATSERFPIVAIEGTRVFVDGVPVATTQVLLDAARLMKLDEVFDALTAKREQWKATHATAYPGVCGLRVASDVPMLVVKSVFQTIAFAGNPTILVQLAADPTRVIPMAAQIPGPPVADASESASKPARVCHALAADTSEYVLTWKEGATVLEEVHIPAGAPDLGAKLCAGWRKTGQHQDPNDAVPDELVLHGDNREGLALLMPVVNAAETCTRKGPGGADVPAFFLTFSIR